MPQARDDSLLLLTASHETLIRKPSEQAAFARKVEKGHFYITNEAVMDGHSSALLCREFSERSNSQSSKLQPVLSDHVRIGPVTGIKVFKSVTFCERSTSTVTATRQSELNRMPDNLCPQRLTTKFLKPRHHTSR